MRFGRAASAAPSDDDSPEPRGGYPWWEYAIVIGVAVLVLGGAILLVRALMGTSEPEAAPVVPTAPVQPLECPAELWYDVTINSCLPRAECAADQAYDERTNTCAAVTLGISGVDPARGPAAGGTEITITGSAFQDGATVTVGGAPATDVTVSDPSTIVARTPASDADFPVDIVITNPDEQTATLDNAFVYGSAESDFIRAVQPEEGSSDGGEAVLIKGRDFQDGAVVAFDARPATDVVVLNDTTIRAIIPAGPLGSVSVNVRNPGQEARTLADGFTYVNRPPRLVTAVRPVKGAQGGSTPIVITGSGFAKDAVVTLGEVTATKVKVVSSTRITAVTPPGELGPVDVSVRNPGVPAAILAEAFTYVEAPTITAIKPAQGPEAGGTKVTITGSGFLKGAKVTVAGAPATAVSVKSDSSLTAITPAGTAGPATIVVTNPGQPPATAKKGFTYTAAVVPTPGPTPKPTATPTGPALPRCKTFTYATVTTSTPGNTLRFTSAELFPADVKGARLLSASFASAPGTDAGSIDWRADPVRIQWRSPADGPASGTITFAYEADSCSGTAPGNTIPVTSGSP